MSKHFDESRKEKNSLLTGVIGSLVVWYLAFLADMGACVVPTTPLTTPLCNVSFVPSTGCSRPPTFKNDQQVLAQRESCDFLGFLRIIVRSLTYNIIHLEENVVIWCYIYLKKKFNWSCFSLEKVWACLWMIEYSVTIKLQNVINSYVTFARQMLNVNVGLKSAWAQKKHLWWMCGLVKCCWRLN